jgi:hypothetical protein
MGRKSTAKWVYILKDATLSYRESDINKFIQMWNDGESVGAIAEELNVKIRDVYLLVIECATEEEIEPRPGAMEGSKEHKWKQRVKVNE